MSETASTASTATGLATLIENDQDWIEGLLSITDRETSNVIDFKCSNFQEHYLKWYKTKRRRIILKPRQIYASTIILAKNFKKAVTTPGTRVLTITHEDRSTRLFRLAIRSWCEQLKALGVLPIVEDDSAELISFPNLNSYMVFATAGGKLGGRSTAFNTVHLSEVAHWPGDAAATIGGIIPSIPEDGELDVESTPRGAEGPFHDYYTDAKDGEIDWGYIFWPWFNNPTNVRAVSGPLNLTPKEQIFQKRHQLVDEQMSWRQNKIAEMKRTAVSDNETGIFAQEYPEDDVTCFLTGVDGVFDADILQEMVEFLIPPIIKHEEWDIWKGYSEGMPYIIGADPSEGKSDFSAGSIVEAVSLEMVAKYHAKTIPSHFADVLYKGSQMYGNAMIAVETPGPGGRVLDHLTGKYNHDNLYFHTDDFTGKVNEDPGWPQNTKTRSIILDTLQTSTSSRSFRVYDERTVREMASFTWQRAGSRRRVRAEAAPGAKDDLIFSLGIALATAPEALRQHRSKHGVDNNSRRAWPFDNGVPMKERRSSPIRSYM